MTNLATGKFNQETRERILMAWHHELNIRKCFSCSLMAEIDCCTHDMRPETIQGKEPRGPFTINLPKRLFRVSTAKESA